MKDNDVLAFIEAAWEGMADQADSLSVYRGQYCEKVQFAAYPKGDTYCKSRLESDTIEGLMRQLAEFTPEKKRAERIASLEAELAELKGGKS